MGSECTVADEATLAYAVLAAAVARGASDVHLREGQPPWLRIEGALRSLADALPVEVEPVLRQLLPAAALQQWQSDGDLDAACALPALGRFRVNAFRSQTGAAAVLRVIPDQVTPLAQLGGPAVLAQLARLDHGLVLVTGPTGSGKSTTLAALVDAINRERPAHIVTLEDPIEFVHVAHRSLISQREIGRDTASFETALRAALREDPDVLLVGELRDLLTMRLALAAAETGHLVLATLHTAGAASTVDRLVSVFPQGEQALVRNQLADSLQAVVSQRLLPRRGGGRVALHEVLVSTPAVRNLIREHRLAQLHSAMQTGQSLGMQTFEQALRHALARGEITSELAGLHGAGGLSGG